MSVPVPTHCVVNAMMSGMVKSVMTELHAVSVTESATSPLASMEKTLLELPPGLHAMSMTPMKNTGWSPATEATVQANNGRRMI